MTIARACAGVGLSRAAWYRPRIDWAHRDAPVVEALNQALAKNGRWGCWLCFDWLGNRGHRWNHKRCWRVDCQRRLNLPRRHKRRLPPIARQPLVAPAEKNQIWALDFMQDARYSGRAFRTFGPELRAQAFVDWCEQHAIEMRFIQPGEPQQNAFVERFNRTYRHEVLDAYVFDSLEQVRLISERWLRLYNEERPHRALGRLPPARFVERRQKLENSSYPAST